MVWSDFEGVCRWRYRLMPLRPELSDAAEQLRREVGSDGRLMANPRRENFYEIIPGRRWYFVHVHRASRTIYLIASASVARIARPIQPAVESSQLRSEPAAPQPVAGV